MRLSNAKRDDIIGRAVDMAYPLKLMTEARNDVGAAIYTEMKKRIPTQWERYSKYIVINNSVFIRTPHHGSQRFTCPEYPVVRNGLPDVPSYEELPKPLQEKVDSFCSMLGRMEEFRREVKAVVYSCTTTKQLIEALPELEECAGDQVVAAGLPVAVETINHVRSVLSMGKVN